LFPKSIEEDSLMPELVVWILLVGIDFYFDKNYRLRGAVNDVSDIEEYLKEFYKGCMGVKATKLVASVTEDPGQEFPPEAENLWPTYDNFTAELRRITSKASPDDIVYIHYSGHGTLRLATSSEHTYQEECGTDAALVLYEPKSQSKVRYLRGIELALLLDNMVEKGLKLTIVLDSCCSGGISRKEDRLVRGIPWNFEVDLEFPLKVPMSCGSDPPKNRIFRNASIKSHWLLNPKRYALLAACGPHELAKEIFLKVKKQYNGALSYHVLKALDFCVRHRVQGITHKQVFQHIRAEMHINVAEQHPLLIGAEKTTFLGPEVSSSNAPSVYEIIEVYPNQEVSLNVGLIHGVCIGDEYVVKSHAESTEVVAHVIITTIHDVHSVAKLSTEISLKQNSPPIKVGYCAILAALGQPRAYVKLFSGVDSAWEVMLEKSVWLQQIPLNELAPIDIPCFSVVKTDSQQYTILDAQDCPIPNLPTIEQSKPLAGNEILTVVEHLSRYAFVKNLDNRRANNLLNSDFLITAKPEIDVSDALKSDDSIIVPHNSKVQFTFENLTHEVLYFAVLDLKPLWAIKNFCIQHREYQTVLPKGPCREVDQAPTVVTFGSRMTIPKQLREKKADCIRQEDVLKFIVSTSPVLGVKAMELPDLWKEMEEAAPVPGSGDKAFGMLMRKSLVGEDEGIGRMRGTRTEVRWACQSVKIHTVLNVAPGASSGEVGGEGSAATPSG
jgi:hypothetical protein